MKPTFVTLSALAMLALAGCEVNVTSNDPETRETINEVQAGAEDLLNDAGNAAEEAAGDLGNAARDTGEELGDIGNAIDNDVDVDTGNQAE